MKRLLEKTDAWGNPAAIWVLAVAVFLIPLIGYGVSLVHISNDVEDWLPDNDPHSRTFEWYQQHFPSAQQVLVSWRGARLGDPRIAELAARLRGEVDEFGIPRGGSRYVQEVMTPADGIQAITKRDVPREEALRRLTGLLVGKPQKEGEASSRPAALVVGLSPAGSADRAAAVESLVSAAKDVGIPRAQLALGGSAVAGSALNVSLAKVLWNKDAPIWMLHRRSPMLLSIVVAVAMAFFVLRSFRVTALVLGGTLLPTLGAVALVPATGGGMNMVLVLMPTLMMVLTISAAIHVVHYRDRAALSGAADPAAVATRTAWGPTIIAESTTAIGLVSLISSPLAPIREFGLYSAIGCVFLLLPVVLWVIPSAMQLVKFPVHGESAHGSRGWRRAGFFLVRHRRAVITMSLVLLVAGTGGLYWFHTETRAVYYLPEDSQVARDYRFLERELAGIMPVEVVVAFDEQAQERMPFAARLERVRTVTESLRQHPEVSGAISMATFLPETSMPPAEASFAAKAAYHRRSSIAEKRSKEEGADAAKFLTECQRQPSSSASSGQAIERGDELWRVMAHASMTSDADLARLVSELDAAVQKGLSSVKGAEHVVTGAVPLFLRTQQALLDSLIYSFATGFLMISGVIAWMLRSLWAGMLAMLPNVLPVAVIFGTVSASGMAFDVGTMISASIAIGIAVDGTLHLCETFRDEHARGVSRRRAVAEMMAANGPALVQTVLVVSGGWLMLATSELALVSRFGMLMAVLVATALIGDLIVLPALLAGPLGRALKKKRTSDFSALDSGTADEATGSISGKRAA